MMIVNLLEIQVARNFSITAGSGIPEYNPVVEGIRQVGELYIDVATAYGHGDRLRCVRCNIVTAPVVYINEPFVGGEVTGRINMFHFISAAGCGLLPEVYADTVSAAAR